MLRHLLRGGVAACPGMACVLCAVQSEAKFRSTKCHKIVMYV